MTQKSASREDTMVKKLLQGAVKVILDSEDYETLRSWLEGEIPSFFLASGTVPDVEALSFLDSAVIRGMSVQAARQIWNVTPLPGNNFRPSPLEEPGRNERCPCGSGKKYKRCCGSLGFAQIPSIAPELIWMLLMETLPSPEVRELIRSGKAPIEPLLGLAEEFLDEGKPKKGVALLEPLFEDGLRCHDQLHGAALTLLFNLYDDLGYWRKKDKLIKRVVEKAPPSPLRAEAFERLATIRMDRGDVSGAWKAFEEARADAPDSPGVALLEVHLLISENRLDLAAERARFHARRLVKQGYDAEAPFVCFLEEVAEDPARAMAYIFEDEDESPGEWLHLWLKSVEARPVPRYDLTRVAVGDATDAGSHKGVERQLRGMGVPRDQRLALSGELFPEYSAAGDGSDGVEQNEGPAGFFLIPPRGWDDLEKEWEEVFPCEKPFSINYLPFNDGDLWDPEAEDAWTTFLEEHPESFDSLDILDDLATAVIVHPEGETPWMDEFLLEPILRRGKAILEQALSGKDDVVLEWGFTENRPPLRLLTRLITLCNRRQDYEQALRLAEWMLRLNPNDNHGFRELVMNRYLVSGEDEKALALADRYPGDYACEILYGKVLAFYRTGRIEEAEEAFHVAEKTLPKVVRYLTATRIKKPKVDLNAVTLGGDDQAWIYREEMRKVWKETPGMIKWLKGISTGSRRPQQEASQG